MSSPNAKNIVELRQMLARKFPGVRLTAEAPPALAQRIPTGLPQVDQALEGGLPRGGITEIITPGIASGALLLLNHLLQQAHARGEWLALVDGSDSFDPAALDNETLSRLLWVRCGSPQEAVKATDLLLHDSTLSLVVLDLAFCAPTQVRKISSSTWFRLQRILDHAATALVVIAPEHMITLAGARLNLERRFQLEAIDEDRAVLRAQIAPAGTEAAPRRIVKIA